MYDIIFLLCFLFIKHSVVNKIVEDRVDNLSNNSVEVKVDRSSWGKDKTVAFRRKLENLLRALAVNTMPGVMLLNMCESNNFSFRRLRPKVVGVACET